MSTIAMGTWVISNFFAPPVDPAMLNRIQNAGGNVVVTSESQEAAAGLDLQALTELVATVKTATELEEALNKPDGINNLDLNGDGQVDFIQVKEFGEASVENTKRGFTLLTEVAQGQVQEIATIEIISNTTTGANGKQQVQVNTYGNEQVYGREHGYSSMYPMASFFLMGYFLNSGGFYTSPYGFGRYPGYYNAYSAVNTSRYRTQTSPFSSKFKGTTVNRGPTMNSPYRGRSASEGITRNLRNPTSSQRSFQSRASSASRNLGKGGFGRKNFNTTTRRNPFGLGNSTARSSRGIFGRSSRSFSRGFGGFGRGFRGFRR